MQAQLAAQLAADRAQQAPPPRALFARGNPVLNPYAPALAAIRHVIPFPAPAPLAPSAQLAALIAVVPLRVGGVVRLRAVVLLPGFATDPIMNVV